MRKTVAKKRNQGFTLIELAIALVIMGIVLATLPSMLQAVTDIWVSSSKNSNDEAMFFIADLEIASPLFISVDVQDSNSVVIKTDSCTLTISYDDKSKMLKKQVSCAGAKPSIIGGNISVRVNGFRAVKDGNGAVMEISTISGDMLRYRVVPMS